MQKILLLEICHVDAMFGIVVLSQLLVWLQRVSKCFDMLIHDTVQNTSYIRTPPSKCPGERSDFHRVLVTEGYGQIFSGELEFCNEDSIIIGGNCFYVKNNSSNFSLGFACLLPRFHL